MTYDMIRVSTHLFFVKSEHKKKKKSELFHRQKLFGILRPDLRDLKPSNGAVQGIEHPVRLVTHLSNRPINADHPPLPGLNL